MLFRSSASWGAPAAPASTWYNAGLIPLFKSFCARAGALPYVVSEDSEAINVRVTDCGCSFDFIGKSLSLRDIRIRMVGRYQVSNAALALSVLERTWDRFPRLTPESVREGMEAAFWPGHLEVVRKAPLSAPRSHRR